jgi:carbon-monoxide dehydrogenase medium subunit
VIPAQVDYLRASSFEDAFAALADPESKALAGGQSLISVMKLRLARPTLLVDIAALDFQGVDLDDGEVRIGALSVWDQLARAPELLRPAFTAIAECAAGIGDLQVRNRGTLGGSLAHADPASDIPAVVLALGAGLRLRSPEGERTVDPADFFLGPFMTALGPQELVTSVVFPVPPPGSGSAYVSIEHPASGFAIAGAAALVHPEGSHTVAVTGVSDRPFLLASDGEPGEALARTESFGDHFCPAEYRRHLGAVVVRRALERARERVEEDAQWQA